MTSSSVSRSGRRRDYTISRQEQDERALQSHQRAVAAHRDGRFPEEIVPIEVPGRKGDVVTVRVDEHPRTDVSFESLAALKAVRSNIDPDATVTAGNASGQNDGAAICLVTTLARADELGVSAFARLVSWALAGVPPSHIGHRPGAGHRSRAGSCRPHHARPGPHRNQRSHRRSGSRLHAGVGLRRTIGIGLGPDQRQRVWDIARTSRRRYRRPDSGHDAARAKAAPRPIRARDHVHRRRAGASCCIRASRLRLSSVTITW